MRVNRGTSILAIVTTAALPWMTPTAVNPLLRAAYLARRGLDVTHRHTVPRAERTEKIIHPNMIFEQARGTGGVRQQVGRGALRV